jgi:hypothetical protein
LVDFDVRKFSPLTHREPQVRERLERKGFSHVLCLKERYKGPTHTPTVENWLRASRAVSTPLGALWRVRFVWGLAVVRKSVALGPDVCCQSLRTRGSACSSRSPSSATHRTSIRS